MKFSRTPLPWRASWAGFERSPSIVAQRDGKPFTVAEFAVAEDRNAVLHAMSVHDELVTALRDMLDSAVSTSPYESLWPQPMRRARAALSKARGDQP